MKKRNKVFIGVISTLICLMAIGVYILTPVKRIGPPLKSIELSAFDIDGISTGEQSDQLRTSVMKLNGVTACTVNKQTRLAAVTYYPDVTTERNVKQALAYNGMYTIAKHQYPVDAKGGCPVSGIQSFLDKVFN